MSNYRFFSNFADEKKKWGKTMKNHKVYESNDQMISLIRDNYNVLQSLGSFGIALGFGDKTVNETCQDKWC